MPDNNGKLYAKFLDFMVESGALLFGDFTLKSGRKSPYFINTGEYKTGQQMSTLGEYYARLIQNSVIDSPKDLKYQFSDDENAAINAKLREKFTVLFGPAYKGIPLVTAAASRLAVSGADFYVSFDRKERKDHGESGLILGYMPQDGDKIAIVEDVTTAGTSVRETAKLLKDLGINAEITALYISVDRMERGTGDKSAIDQLREELGIEVFAIATAEQIIDYLENTPSGCREVPGRQKLAENMRKYLSEYGAKK